MKWLGYIVLMLIAEAGIAGTIVKAPDQKGELVVTISEGIKSMLVPGENLTLRFKDKSLSVSVLNLLKNPGEITVKIRDGKNADSIAAEKGASFTLQSPNTLVEQDIAR